jgi:hypothetical protein
MHVSNDRRCWPCERPGACRCSVTSTRTHPCASSAPFFDEAADLGVRVIALAPDARDDHARAIARRCNSACVTLPADYDLLPATLRPMELA